MMYQSNFWKFPTLSRVQQPAGAPEIMQLTKSKQNGGNIKLTIDDV